MVNNKLIQAKNDIEASCDDVVSASDPLEAGHIMMEEIQDRRSNRKLRPWILGIILVIVICHLVFLDYIIKHAGYENVSNGLPFMSDHVMMTFMSTTTADILALLYVCLRFLFPHKK